MGLRRLSLYRSVAGLLLSLLACVPVWAAPDTTLTIAPSATAGATITAADENDRNNDISTAYNAHSHTDISSTTANTFTLGDGAAGNKTLCANAADTTDACIRWNDTANLWTLDNPTPGSFNQIATISGTAGISGLLLGDGTGSLTSLTPGTSGTGAIFQSGSNTLVGLSLGDDTLMVGNTNGPGSVKLPNCSGSTSALNYATSGNSFSCQTISTSTDRAVLSVSTSGATADRYFPLFGGSSEQGDATEANINNSVLPYTATAKNLYCSFTGAPGAGTSWAITVRDDGSNTALTCTISDAGTTCSDTSNTPSIAAGSIVTIFWDATGGVAGSNLSGCQLEIDG